MGRTQIYLGDAELALLDDARRATGASRSELIRRAIHSAYGRQTRSREERLANIMAAAGIWKDRPFTTEQYLEAIRGSGGLNERLRRIGIE